VNPTTSQNSTEHTRRSATGSPARPAAPAGTLAAAGPDASSANAEPQP
jgi:hypothetical protein